MKKFVLYPILILVTLILLIVLGVGGVLFFKPTILVNPKNIEWVLNKTQILKKWSWSDAVISHEYVKWNDRIISGHFNDLCLQYENETIALDTCIKKISWDFRVTYDKGLKSIATEPVFIRSDFLRVTIKDNPNPPPPEPSSPPNIWGYWSMLWSPLIPELDFLFEKNEIHVAKKDVVFDIELKKNAKELNIYSFGFHLWATPELLKIMAPKKYEIPYDLKFTSRLHLIDTELTLQMKEEGIPILLTGALESIPFKVESYLDLPIKDGFNTLSFKKKTILATKASIHVDDVKKNIGRFAPKPFNVLPAPLNDMDGSIKIDVTTHKNPENKNGVIVKALTFLDMKSVDQALMMDIFTDVGLDLVKLAPETVLVGVDFKKVRIKLPRISKKSLPPQFLPDSRFKESIAETKKPKPKSDLEMSFKIEALEDKSLALTSNLVDEPVRLNIDLLVNNGNVDTGYVKLLPLKTTVFKRKIHIPSMDVKFNHPTEPVLEGVVKFLLPLYEVKMDLEGPISEPRFALTSTPPLSRNDIYAVLLFGRTLADLDPDDKRAANQSNQIFANGILSLSVLYFLSGSPVEYVGYDPDSKNATAQIGLGKKSSLRVGGGGGETSTGIRHSIGKGWYLDTSATQTQPTSTTQKSNSTDFGVMLERIIAY